MSLIDDVKCSANAMARDGNKLRARANMQNALVLASNCASASMQLC